MVIELAETETGRKLGYCPHHEDYVSAELFSDSNVVCMDCAEKTGRVMRGLPPDVPHVAAYERMRDENPEEYQRVQEAKHEKQLANISKILASVPKPLRAGALSGYKDVAEKVAAYFETTALMAEGDVIDRRTAKPPTLTGLANALGVGLNVIKTYREREFIEAEQKTIKAIVVTAVQLIAQYAEESIYSHNFNGARFHLSKILPDVFGDNDVGSTSIIAVIDNDHRDRVMNYIATKFVNNGAERNSPLKIEAVDVTDTLTESEVEKEDPTLI